MKLKNIKYIIPIMFIGILALMSSVYAKTSIEIKPNASTVYTNKTISSFFEETLAMKNTGEGLEGSNVDVHMATDTDWAIFAYFSNSQYGTSGAGQNTGVNVTIGGKTYKSTNGNITGMMDLGKTRTGTSSIISNFEDIVDTETTEEPYDWGKSIIENVNNSVHVSVVDYKAGNKQKRVAANWWYGTNTYISNDIGTPYAQRIGLFEYGIGQLGKRFYWRGIRE